MLPKSAPSVAILTARRSGATTEVAPGSQPRGRDREPGQTERLEMRVPGRAIGEVLARMLSEQLDHRPCQVALVHVGEGSAIENVVLVTSAQELEKVAPALGEGGGEEGEAIVPDLSGHAVPGAMAGAGVVDGDPRGGLEAGAQDRLGLVDEGRALGGQEPHHLALGDGHAETIQKGRDSLGRDLTLMMLQEHEP